MTKTLFIIAAIGLVVFLISYLRIIIASFRHHAVTGLISIFPGINLAVLPTVWAKMSKAFPLSILGLVMAVGGWYAGGNQYLSQRQIDPVAESAQTFTQKTHVTTEKHKIRELPLPQKPLYYIRFKKVDISQLDSLLDHHIRIKLIDDRELEGKNIKNSSSSLLIETYNNGNSQVIKVPSKHIKSIEKLVRSDR